MRHLKLYEQFDLDDFSEEEIFGEQKDLFLGKNGNIFYILCKIDGNICVFDHIETFSPSTFYFDGSKPNEDSKVIYKSSSGTWYENFLWKDIPKKIKDRIKL